MNRPDKNSIGEGNTRGYHNAFDKRITHKTDFTPVRAALMKFADHKGNPPVGFERPFRITLTAGEDLDKYQRGTLVITIDRGSKRERILVSMDAVMSVIYAVYPQAK